MMLVGWGWCWWWLDGGAGGCNADDGSVDEDGCDNPVDGTDGAGRGGYNADDGSVDGSGGAGNNTDITNTVGSDLDKELPGGKMAW